MNTIVLPACPKCGCYDIRIEEWVGCKCFKCGYVMPKDPGSTVYKVEEK